MNQCHNLQNIIVFCDLDGTLILDNSFHLFIATLWGAGTSRQRVSLMIRLMPRLLGNMTGGQSGMKRRVLVWFARQDEIWRKNVINALLLRLQPTMSRPVLQKIDELLKKDAHIVLATAAPDIYAVLLASQIGASACLATEGTIGPQWCELLAASKAGACKRYIRQHFPHNAGQIVVITDHADDLPLLRLADHAVIQAQPEAISRIKAGLRSEVLLIEEINVTGSQEGGGYWLWFDDRPIGPLDVWEVRTVLSKHRHALLYIGNGLWRCIGQGRSLADSVLRRDCPRPPSSIHRFITIQRRRLLRDILQIYH
jgi:phosphoserine phosphatase